MEGKEQHLLKKKSKPLSKVMEGSEQVNGSKRSHISVDMVPLELELGAFQGDECAPDGETSLRAVFNSVSDVNPFVNYTPKVRSCESVMETVYIAIVVLPFRLVLYGVSIAIAWIIDVIATTGVDLSKPFPPWRKNLVNKTTGLWKAWLFAQSYQSIEVIGKPADRSEAPISVINHTSFLDPFVLFAIGKFSLVAKQEVLKIPFGGNVIKAGQMIFVDRTCRESSACAKDMILKRCNEKDWPTINMFPEGTCTNGKALITFKTGAFSPGVPVQPVLMIYKWKTVDPSKVYGGGPGVGSLTWKLLMSPPNSVVVKYLDVYYPNEMERKDPHLYAENVRILMAKSMDVNLTNHSYADVQMLINASKMHIPNRDLEKFNMETSLLQKILNADCTVEDFKYFMKKFADEAGDTGELRKETFFKIMKMPRNPITERIYQMFDIDGNGVLQFREFMAGIALLYYSHDPEISLGIVGARSDSGRLYFDRTEAFFTKTMMKSFAFSRKWNLRSYSDKTEEDFDKVWWTPEELSEYMEKHPYMFSWLQNPKIAQECEKMGGKD